MTPVIEPSSFWRHRDRIGTFGVDAVLSGFEVDDAPKKEKTDFLAAGVG